MQNLLISLMLIVFGAFHSPETPKKTPQTNPLDKYVGIYRVGSSFQMRVYISNGNQLMLSVPQEPDYKLINQTKHRFDIKGLKGYQVVFQIRKNSSKKFTIIRPRKDFPNDLVAVRKKKLDRFAIDVDAKLTETKESTHFRFKFSKVDVNEIPTIEQSLEANYVELLKRFDIEQLPKVLVNIYPNKSTYLIAVNQPTSNIQIQLATEWGKQEIRMTSTQVLKGKNYLDMVTKRGALHEFVHVLHKNISNKASNPGWLYEGTAMYLSKCCMEFKPKKIGYLRNKKRYSFQKIERDPTYKKKYVVGPYIVEFIEQKYGWVKVLELMKNEGNIQQTFGINQTAFETQFYDFLEKKYLD